ncbi:DUF2892 domain-containing protein [Methylosinus sporium]|uniref:DUF2892 domain-containing protein n=1 Tax=Methylosinus sporium TaxID=428 RepID=A0A549SLI6_METSR|nr:DUF2892 domain-containing protein [Methylosinus sporium]TRL30485.1 DUF2892 domain-containing protein [Methylosinus sporium]
MTRNVGTIDRIFRLAIVAAIALAYWLGALSGGLAIALGVVAIIAFATSLVCFCPAYRLFGISTCKRV